jgi:hypothetical protein
MTYDPDYYFHAEHICGHKVYWSNPYWALSTKTSPCPWCGGGDGSLDIPSTQPIIKTPGDDDTIFCFNAFNPDGTIPQWYKSSTRKRVIVRHKYEICGCPDREDE